MKILELYLITVQLLKAIFDINIGAFLSITKGDTAIIGAIDFKSYDEFVTVDPKHFKFWTFNNKSMKSRKGIASVSDKVEILIAANTGIP